MAGVIEKTMKGHKALVDDRMKSLPVIKKGKPTACQIVADLLSLMNDNLHNSIEVSDEKTLERMSGEYAGLGQAIEIIRWRIVGSTGYPMNTMEWAEQFATRTE